MKPSMCKAILAVVLLMAGLPGAAGPREETVGVLESIAPSPDAGRLVAWLARADDGPVPARSSRSQSVTLGEVQRFRFRASSDMFVTAVHVDSQGVVNVLLPSPEIPNHMGAGQEMTFPPEGLEMRAEPPLGQEIVFAFGTRAPIELSGIGLSARDSGFAIVDEADGPRFARRLKAAIESDEHRATAEIRYRIAGRPEVDYRVEDVVAFLTGPRARSVRQSRFGARVHFQTDSAELTGKARRLLDVMGEALTAEEQLAERRFVIAGHTDERGDAGHNLKLSRARAQSVRDYLASHWKIDPQRMQVEAYGETIPWELGDTREAHEMNRRVEFVFSR